MSTRESTAHYSITINRVKHRPASSNENLKTMELESGVYAYNLSTLKSSFKRDKENMESNLVITEELIQGIVSKGTHVKVL